MIDTDNIDGLRNYFKSEWDYTKCKDSRALETWFRKRHGNLLRAGQKSKAEAMLKMIRKFERCRKDFIEFYVLKNPGHRKYNPRYCHSKICPICYPYRSYQGNRKVLSHLLSVEGTMYGVYTISPPNPNVREFKNLATVLKQAPSHVFSKQCRKLSGFIDGTIRFMGLTVGRNGFNLHQHIVLHFTKTLTYEEADKLFRILNERYANRLKPKKFKKFECYLGVYQYTGENLIKTASYLTKYNDHKSLSNNIPNMGIEKYFAYQKAYGNLREIEYTGCYRQSIPMIDLKKVKGEYTDANVNVNGSETTGKLYEFTTGYGMR